MWTETVNSKVQDTQDNALVPHKMGAEALSLPVLLLINGRAGEVLQSDATAITKRFEDAFAGASLPVELAIIDPSEFSGRILEADETRYRCIAVAGGDGTVNAILSAMTASPLPLAVLPLGTLNVLASDLGMTGILDQDVKIIAEGHVTRIDIGRINGRYFHSNAGIGFFATMAKRREEARHQIPFSKKLGYVWALTQSLFGSRPTSVIIDIDGHRQDFVADAVLVTINAYDEATRRRSVLDGGHLEIHLLSAPSTASRLRAGWSVMRGSWRRLPNLTSFPTPQMEIHRSSQRPRTVSVDGERLRLHSPLRITIEPRALEVVIRRNDDT
jgi:diacylglycerol kinase family enzyme